VPLAFLGKGEDGEFLHRHPAGATLATETDAQLLDNGNVVLVEKGPEGRFPGPAGSSSGFGRGDRS
jgi:hypothetical protein